METWELELCRKWQIRSLTPPQREVLTAIRPDFLSSVGTRTLALMPTGAGKTLCFQAASAWFHGVTIVIYPLLALMEDQARRHRQGGLNTRVLRGGQTKAVRDEIWKDLNSGRLQLLVTNPEMVVQPSVLARLCGRVAHVVLDEAHCVVQWGQTFRPAYAKLAEALEFWNPLHLSAFTATLGPEGRQDLEALIFQGKPLRRFLFSPDRPRLRLEVVKTAWPLRALDELWMDWTPPCVIFVRDRARAQTAAENLSRRWPGRVRYYHAGLGPENRRELETWFFQSSDGFLVATNGYGMGVDKPNIRTVVHLDAPPDLESYLQEAGRAGRDNGPATAWFLWVPGESELWDGLWSRRDCRRSPVLDRLGFPEISCHGCDACTGPRTEHADRLWSRFADRWHRESPKGLPQRLWAVFKRQGLKTDAFWWRGLVQKPK